MRKKKRGFVLGADECSTALRGSDAWRWSEAVEPSLGDIGTSTQLAR